MAEEAGGMSEEDETDDESIVATQEVLAEKIGEYLRQTRGEAAGEIAEDVEDIIGEFSEGGCAGISSLWLYSMWLDTVPCRLCLRLMLVELIRKVKTALMLAVENDYPEIVETLLLSKKIAPNDVGIKMAYAYVFKNNHRHIMQALSLLHYGSNANMGGGPSQPLRGLFAAENEEMRLNRQMNREQSNAKHAEDENTESTHKPRPM